MVGSVLKFIKLKYGQIKINKKILLITIVLIVFISLGTGFGYGKYKQEVEYKKWLTESNSRNNNTPGFASLIKLRELDGLKMGQTKNSNGSTDQIDSDDLNTRFIKSYYEKIAQKDFEAAYKMSKKSVDLETFSGWYKNTNEIVVDKVTRIDEKKSSLELTLKEGITITRYGVLMTLMMQNGVPIQVENSEVRLLSSNGDSDNPSFFDNNLGTSLMATNDDFKKMILEGSGRMIVLDARENIEYENGNFPGSLHIRFADLKAGRWIELPENKVVYVLCWSGIRGKEVAQFLREKNILARYIENGASGWVAFGGTWIGNINFAEKYNEYRFQKVLNTMETKSETKKGAVLVDCREPNKYNQDHIAGAINIPTMYIPSIQYEDVLAQLPPNSKVVAICDGYVNCFDAKVTGVELEKRGHTLIGRYNKPWEYGK